MFHERVLFGSAFADAGFVAARAVSAEYEAAEWVTIADVAQPAEGIDEADAMHADTLILGGPQHDQPHQVVGQSDHQEFFVDAGDGFAAEHVQVQRLLEMPQVHLDLPAVGIELGQFRGRISLRVQERGDQQHFSRAIAGLPDAVAQFADQDRRRQRGISLGRDPRRAPAGLEPLDDLVAVAELGAIPVVPGTGFGVGLELIVKVCAMEVPPPGAGVNTVTEALPAVAMSAADIVASSVVAFTNVVARSAPFQRTTEPLMKLLPVAVSVNPVSPAVAEVGETLFRVGDGLLGPLRLVRTKLSKR